MNDAEVTGIFTLALHYALPSSQHSVECTHHVQLQFFIVFIFHFFVIRVFVIDKWLQLCDIAHTAQDRPADNRASLDSRWIERELFISLFPTQWFEDPQKTLDNHFDE